MINGIDKPKAVFLDLDDTLYSYDPANQAGMESVFYFLKEKYSIDSNLLNDCFTKAKDRVKFLVGDQGSSHSRLLYFKSMLEIMGLKTQSSLSLRLEAMFWSNFLRSAKLYQNVVEFLYLLRQLDIKIVILTDLTTQIQLKKLVYFNIDKLIDFVVSSEEVGCEKPNSKIFEQAINLVECEPKEVLMIGDSFEKDIKGALNMGIHALQKISSASKTKTLKSYKYSFDSYETLMYYIKKNWK